VLYVAFPLLSDPVPRVDAPSLKVTFPVTVDGVTVAVKLTVCPKVDGLSEETTVVVVLALFTVSVPFEDA
jgi:hypothetical protein